MKIRRACGLAKLYSDSNRPILEKSPELQFMYAICNQDFETALGLFKENKLFGNVPSAVDAPYGRYEGLSEIRKFVFLITSLAIYSLI
jgi:hypothetical protein